VKHADIETLVWLIVAAVIVLGKGWNKLQGQIAKDTSKSKETPPVTPARPKLQRPRPAPVGARPVAAPMRRTVSPLQRTASRMAPAPVGSAPARDTWRVDPEQIRRFMEQLSGQARPVPPPIARPPVQKAEPAAPPPPVAEEPAPTPAAAVPAPAIASRSATPAPSRAAQWAEALRDRQNIRNIIISYEIIGPPKAFQ